MEDTFKGRDMFGREVIGVSGKSASIVLLCKGDEGDGESDTTVSLDAKSVEGLRAWLSAAASQALTVDARLINLLRRAGDEIRWWEGEHSCCAGKSDDLLAEIGRVLATTPEASSAEKAHPDVTRIRQRLADFERLIVDGKANLVEIGSNAGVGTITLSITLRERASGPSLPT